MIHGPSNVKLTIVALGKSINITYSESVFVALFIQHAKRMRRIILSSVVSGCPVFSPNYPTNGTNSGKRLLNIKCLFWPTLKFLSKTFLTPRRFQRDFIINVHRSIRKVTPVILFTILSIHFYKKKILRYQISWKTVRWELSCSMRTDARTDRQTWMTQMTKLRIDFRKRLKLLKITRKISVSLIL